MQSPSEEVCKRRFDAFLGQVSPAHKRCWHDVDPVAEPPDYYLELDEARYAVEVTTLTSELQLGSRSVPQVGAVEALRGFVKAIEDRARRDHLLRGSYVVAFRRPIDDFHMLRQGIADSLLDYIRETSDLCSAPEEVVFRRGAACYLPRPRAGAQTHLTSQNICATISAIRGAGSLPHPGPARRTKMASENNHRNRENRTSTTSHSNIKP